MASKKVTVSFPVVRDGETVRTREVQVSEDLAKKELAKKGNARHRAWRGAELVTKAAKTETK